MQSLRRLSKSPSQSIHDGFKIGFLAERLLKRVVVYFDVNARPILCKQQFCSHGFMARKRCPWNAPVPGYVQFSVAYADLHGAVFDKSDCLFHVLGRIPQW